MYTGAKSVPLNLSELWPEQQLNTQTFYVLKSEVIVLTVAFVMGIDGLIMF